ncbi:uncharacterized protein LACBIDRAFT_295062 [Laccaria bicolor S238N-H82]|uniref:Predicted protein n=1 Tax=Laccaria bicolor (strain S238N-H82 / ATCC MYA-4686) TaxID=486041 RepID=B0DLW0_LACBS|nr:uncharacterized protein LACBIDRAFT_295062 [Laccaria bicolor S238N-H82]EDR04464.1 predicted protein [Laccaria bicolor S238N-H82]|eukprot:XP_001884983.1 predicted protein [Laccaria bicolor S238N-H82]
MLVCKIKIPHVAHNGVHISSVRTPRVNRVQRGQSQALIHLEEFGISAALLNKTYQSIIIVVDILLVDAADPEDVKLWYVEDEGPRFPVVDPDGAVLLMREWKALQTNQQYQTMDAMDAVVTKHRTIDLRVEKIVVIVHWIGMDTNSQANVNVNARVYYKEETLPPPPRALPAERLIGS